MIHVVFQEADVSVLKQAIELDESLQGEVILIRDDFAVGPIANLDTEEGWELRLNWWRELVKATPYPDELVGSFDDRNTVSELLKSLEKNESEVLWIWMGQNQHDVCSYYWLISQLKDYQGRIMVLYMNNLPFINEKGSIFYPSALHEIQPKEFLKAKKLCRKVTLSEFEVDPDEWKKLSDENAMVRILEGGKKIVSIEEDYYDNEILKNLGTEWQKGNRAMNHVLSKMKIKTGDIFLLWRMRKLAEQEKLDINGDMSKSWKDFEVKIKSHAVEPVNEPGTTI